LQKLFNHVTILEFNTNRNLFTRQGLNLNGFRKGLLAKQIASLIYEINGMKNEESMSLKWKMEQN